MDSFFQRNKTTLGFVAAGAIICASAVVHPFAGAVASVLGLLGAAIHYTKRERELLNNGDSIGSRRCSKQMITLAFILPLMAAGLLISGLPNISNIDERDRLIESETNAAREAVLKGQPLPAPEVFVAETGRRGLFWVKEKALFTLSFENPEKDGTAIAKLTTTRDNTPTRTTAWKDLETGQWTVLKSVTLPLPAAKP